MNNWTNSCWAARQGEGSSAFELWAPTRPSACAHWSIVCILIQFKYHVLSWYNLCHWVWLHTSLPLIEYSKMNTQLSTSRVKMRCSRWFGNEKGALWILLVLVVVGISFNFYFIQFQSVPLRKFDVVALVKYNTMDWEKSHYPLFVTPFFFNSFSHKVW